MKKDEIVPYTENDKEMKPNEFQQEIQRLLHTAGTVKLSDKQKKVLYAPVPPEEIQIRPDGFIYLEAGWYRAKMVEAFGMEWSMIPQGLPQKQGGLVMWGFHLMVQGKYIGYGIGEQEYQENNYTMSWGDACEGAKSIALTRLCKGIGVAKELWDRSFVGRWKLKYAERYEAMVRGKKKILWRKKATHIKGDTYSHDVEEAEGVVKQKEKPTTKNFKFLRLMAIYKKDFGEEVYYEALGAAGYEHSDEVVDRQHQESLFNYFKDLQKGEKDESGI